MTDGYMRILRVFNDNPIAHEFLRDDGEGGFASGVDRMAAEITRLRAEVGRQKAKEKRWLQDIELANRASNEAEEQSRRLRAALDAMTAERNAWQRRSVPLKSHPRHEGAEAMIHQDDKPINWASDPDAIIEDDGYSMWREGE